MSNPHLYPEAREKFVSELMSGRRAVRSALKAGDDRALSKAREEVDAAKVALGERGPAWWEDGAPDYNRKMVRTTPYGAWFETLGAVNCGVS